MLKLQTFIVELFIQLTTRKKPSQIAEKAEDITPLLIGEKLPEATLKDKDGNDVELYKILSEKPTVLVFYRGDWCPYCNMQLTELSKIENEILSLGYQIVAISPDDFLNLKNTEEKDEVRYRLLSDNDGNFITEIGIAFRADELTKAYLTAKTRGEPTEILPVPTVMVIDKEANILFEYISPKYSHRINSKLLMAVLETLKK